MGIIAWIVLGLVVGLIAEKVVNGGDSHGVVVTAIIGIVGALLGGWLATNLFHVGGLQGFFNISTWLTAIAGAIILVLLAHLVTGRSGRRHSFRH
jgi:uncharacterized membrane protein YeaQ/YmgE (transglycosylase-associated protein family)